MQDAKDKEVAKKKANEKKRKRETKRKASALTLAGVFECDMVGARRRPTLRRSCHLVGTMKRSEGEEYQSIHVMCGVDNHYNDGTMLYLTQRVACVQSGVPNFAMQRHNQSNTTCENFDVIVKSNL